MKRIFTLFAAVILAAGLAAPAQAQLLAYGPLVDIEGLQFPLWYQDANGLKLEACALAAAGEGEEAVDPCLADFQFGADENDLAILESAEFLYFLAEAQINPFPGQPGQVRNEGRVRLIQALEAFVDPIDGHGVFNALIITGRGFTPGAIYTFYTPYGTYPIEADASGQIGFALPAIHPEGTAEQLFESALGSNLAPMPIDKFLYWDAGVPVENGGNFFIGNPLVPRPIFGSPVGQNFFRVTGPNNFDISTDLFTVVGKIYTGDGNDAAVTNHDMEVTKAATAIDLAVLENDLATNIAINPNSLAFDTTSQGAAGSIARVNDGDRVLLRFTPTGTGIATFTYTVDTFAGFRSEPATVAVFVENLQTTKANYRARTGKWEVAGSSAIPNLSVSLDEGFTTYLTTLTGSQEVPANSSQAGGVVMVTIADGTPATIDIFMEVDTLPATAITAAHIHTGATGVNGPAVVHICSATSVACASHLSEDGLTVDLSGAAVAADVIEAIRSGNAYINVHTEAIPAGEIRGQLGRNVVSLRVGDKVVGIAEVTGTAPNGGWSFAGKSTVAPGTGLQLAPSIPVTETVELKLR